jgi:hypothetical protein
MSESQSNLAEPAATQARVVGIAGRIGAKRDGVSSAIKSCHSPGSATTATRTKGHPVRARISYLAQGTPGLGGDSDQDVVAEGWVDGGVHAELGDPTVTGMPSAFWISTPEYRVQ